MPSLTLAASIVLVIGLSLVAGFATQRGSLCAVAATRDVIRHGRWHRFVGFLQCAAWAWLLLLLAGFFQLEPVVSASVPDVRLWPRTILLPILGGALFGIGAFINGGCSFGTVSRLGRGEMSYLVSLLAMLAGFWLVAGQWSKWFGPVVQTGTVHDTGLPAVAAWLLRGLLAVLVMVNGVQLFRHRAWQLDAWRKRSWPPVMAVLVIAVCNLGLLHLAGQWPGIAAPVDALRNEPVGLLRWLVLPVFVAGAVLGAVSAKRFRWVTPDRWALIRRSVGGFSMGVGAAWVPGGNARMLLVDVPANHWSGVLAYVAMVVVLLAVIGMAQRIRSSKSRK